MRQLFTILAIAMALLPVSWADADTDSAAVRDFKVVDEAVRRHAKLEYTGNPDVDFRKHLIAKRQEIIGMAEVVIAHTSDPVTEALATKVIANQKRDIAEMKRWLESAAR